VLLALGQREEAIWRLEEAIRRAEYPAEAEMEVAKGRGCEVAKWAAKPGAWQPEKLYLEKVSVR
jgi:hypothetical protein